MWSCSKEHELVNQVGAPPWVNANCDDVTDQRQVERNTSCSLKIRTTDARSSFELSQVTGRVQKY